MNAAVIEEIEQQELKPIAKVHGQFVTELPKDLYIPPDALEVFLDAFEGPLDLLLYLIKRQNVDILNIPITQITQQYMEYVEIMKQLQLELAAEYLVMAAMLAEIKSRMLLPRPETTEEEPDDPRAELIKRLQEYERFKKAAENLAELPRVGIDFHLVQVAPPDYKKPRPQPKVDLKEIAIAYMAIIKRSQMLAHHHITMEPLSVRERMTDIVNKVKKENFTDFKDLFDRKEGRMGVVVTLLAILELLCESLIEIVQAEPFAKIYIKAKSS